MPATDATYASLRDCPVLITGGASGIGAALVRAFCGQGARVSFLDIADAAAKALVADLGGAPRYLRCDLRDIAALRAAIGQVGPVRVLVNNAAHDDRHDWRTVTPEYWEDRLAVNLRHQFFAIQAVAPSMQAAKRGSIVNFGSISWHVGTGGMPAYTASKAAVEALTRSFARDLGPDNIRVNTVIPGWIITERQRELWLTPEGEAQLMRDQCLKRLLLPEDIAPMVLWLASEDSRMCTSQTWTCDGGWR